MHERISRLEGHYESLEGRIIGVETKIDKIVNILSEQTAHRPPSIQTVLTIAAVLTGMMGAGVGGFFFLVDHRVGAAVAESNRFVQQMTDKGGIWVDIEKIKSRLASIEANQTALEQKKK